MTDSPDSLSLTGRLWRPPQHNSEKAGASQKEHAELPVWITDILARRGVVGDGAIQEYLSPSLRRLDDPSLMADMPKAIERLTRALEDNEAITVYGDYDVDGVCSTTILVDFLRKVGGSVEYYIPDRRAEGYGLNPDAVRKISEHSKVLITTDCGITAVEEITLARDLGLDVIVVDHHQVPEVLPPAVACLNPHRKDCNYPFKGLCAAGVAFMLVIALRRHLRDTVGFNGDPEPDVRELLDVLAVATVADMVPIQGTNRILVAAGLQQLGRTQRLGMKALMRVSDIDPSRITASDLGFCLGPRINARGRLSSAAEAVELMLTHDAERAQALAKALDSANRSRRDIEKETLDDAAQMVADLGFDEHGALVLYDPDWHPGVLGLVASRLASRFNRPTIVIGDGGKGSGRSVPGFNLHAAMDAASGHLIRFGGHPAAAGLTIEPSNVDAFRVDFCSQVVAERGEPPYVATLEPEMELGAPALTMKVLDHLDCLAPFGQSNPEPLFVSALEVQSSRVVGKSHLKLSLGNGVDAIAFGLGDLHGRIPGRVDVVYRLERNHFRGRQTLQLRVEDLRGVRLVNAILSVWKRA